MRSLSKCDLSIIYQCIDDIIFASNFDNCDYTDNSEGEKDDMAMYDLNIARGIKKILPILPQVAPQYVGVSLNALSGALKSQQKITHRQNQIGMFLKVLMMFCTQRMLEHF